MVCAATPGRGLARPSRGRCGGRPCPRGKEARLATGQKRGASVHTTTAGQQWRAQRGVYGASCRKFRCQEEKQGENSARGVATAAQACLGRGPGRQLGRGAQHAWHKRGSVVQPAGRTAAPSRLHNCPSPPASKAAGTREAAPAQAAGSAWAGSGTGELRACLA